jgi:hypothetical protein
MLTEEDFTGVVPDWKELWTVEEALKELTGFKLNPDFKTARGGFTGWYLTKTDTLLILPSIEPNKFWFLVYNGRNPGQHFASIAAAPVRQDER